MAKYHVNPTTGEVGECTATRRCPFGSAEDHYATPEAARQAYEAENSNSTVAPSVKKSRRLPAPVFAEESRQVVASTLSTANSIDVKGVMAPVLAVKVGYKYAAVSVPDLKRGERVINVPKDETVSALVRTETKESQRLRAQAQLDGWTEDSLRSYTSPRARVAETLAKRVEDGYPLGPAGLSELVEAEAQDRVVADLRAQVEWVRKNEASEELVYNRAVARLQDEYRDDVLRAATDTSTSSNSAYNMYEGAMRLAKAKFVRDGAWVLNL